MAPQKHPYMCCRTVDTKAVTTIKSALHNHLLKKDIWKKENLKTPSSENLSRNFCGLFRKWELNRQTSAKLRLHPCTDTAHELKIQSQDTGQHVSAVWALLSTCFAVCSAHTDSRTLIQWKSKQNYSVIPMERDISHTPLFLSAINIRGGTTSCPSEFHCLFNLLTFSRNLYF